MAHSRSTVLVEIRSWPWQLQRWALLMTMLCFGVVSCRSFFVDGDEFCIFISSCWLDSTSDSVSVVLKSCCHRFKAQFSLHWWLKCSFGSTASQQTEQDIQRWCGSNKIQDPWSCLEWLLHSFTNHRDKINPKCRYLEQPDHSTFHAYLYWGCKRQAEEFKGDIWR